MSTGVLLDIKFARQPASRGLVKHESQCGTQICYFPRDYEDRILDTIDQLHNQYHRECLTSYDACLVTLYFVEN